MIQKQLSSFELGGSILKIFYHHGNTMAFKISHNWHANHQLPLPITWSNEDELWKLKTEKLDLLNLNKSDKIAVEAA